MLTGPLAVMQHELLWTLVAWILILPSAFLAGGCYGALIRQKDPVLRGIFYYALGLATLSYAVVLLSALHLLTSRCLWGILFLPLLFRAHRMREWFQWLKNAWMDLAPGENFFSKVLFALFAVSFFCLLAGTLTPELGGDALCYQLNLPKVFLRHASLAPDFLDFNTFFPLLMNNLYLIGLATGGVFAAKLFHFFCGFLLLLSVKRILQIETGNSRLSYFLALVVFTTPTLYNELSTTYIDVALAFCVFLAAAAFMNALDCGSRKDFFLSGLLIGCSIATKYLALMAAIGLLGVWVYSILRTRRIRPHLVGGGFFLLGLLVVAGYWLIRNGVLTGNPFFPYFGNLFGEANRPPPSGFALFGFSKSWFSYFSLYFNMFLAPDSFGSATTRIGVFYFLFTPFILLSLVFVPWGRRYGVFWLIFTGLLFFLGQVDRYIIPVLPIMAVCAGAGVHWLYGYASLAFKKIIRTGWAIAALSILLVYVAVGVYHYRYAYLLLTGRWSFQKYLSSLERTTAIAQWINENLPKNAKILVESEPRLFYFDRPVVRRENFEWSVPGAATHSDPITRAKLLRLHGITHILSSDLIGKGNVITMMLSDGEALRAAGSAKEIYSAESLNIREDRYRYRLFEITGEL